MTANYCTLAVRACTLLSSQSSKDVFVHMIWGDVTTIADLKMSWNPLNDNSSAMVHFSVTYKSKDNLA